MRLIGLLCALACLGGNAAERNLGTLERGARLWSEIRFRHHAVASGEVDWDGVFVEYGPRLLALKPSDSELVVLSAMIAELHDPFTSVVVAPKRSLWPLDLKLQTEVDGVLWIGLSAIPASIIGDKYYFVTTTIRKASKIVIDLRGQPPLGTEDANVDELLAPLAEALVPRNLRVHGTIGVEHRGLRDELDPSAPSSDVRWSAREAWSGQMNPSVRYPRLVFILEQGAPVPPFVAELCRAGRAKSVGIGKLFVGTRTAYKFPLKDGMIAVIAPNTVSDSGEFIPTVRLSPDDAAEAVAKARALLDRPALLKSQSAKPVLLPPIAPLKPVSARSPTPGERLLAVVKFWSSVKYLYPYVSLAKTPWDDVLPMSLEKMVAADDDAAFVRVIIGMAALLKDSHVGVFGPLVESVRPKGRVPFEVMQLDQEMVVVSSVDNVPSDLAPGWIITSIDGVPAERAVAEMLPVVAGATPAARWQSAAELALAGRVGTVVRLECSDGKAVRSVAIRRVTAAPPRTGPEAFRRTPEGYGYLDLSATSAETMDEVVAGLKGSKGLVVDLRRYPQRPAWIFTSWLNRRAARTTSIVRQPWIAGDAPFGRIVWTFEVPFLESPWPHFAGPVVALIDERTMSAGEDVGLTLEAGTDPVFVGSVSAGTNGITAHIVLPGQVIVRLTATEVTHADGRPLQGVGIRPDVSVRPSAADYRAGRDVLLECAFALLSQSRANENPSEWRKRILSSSVPRPTQCQSSGSVDQR